MAWTKMNYSNEGQDYGQRWYNSETGNWSDTDPNPSGQYSLQTLLNDGMSNQQAVDAVTGHSFGDDPGALAKGQQQETERLDAQFQSVWGNPSASSWEKAMAVQQRYGIEALAQAAGQGHFPDIASELGPHISAAQARVGDKGFTVGGNPLGMYPVYAGMLAGSLLGGAAEGATGAAGESAVAGGSAATGAPGGGGLVNGVMVDGATSGGGLNSTLAAGGASAAAEPFGGFDSQAVAGADYTAAGAEGAGLSLGGAGTAAGGASALSAAGGGSSALSGGDGGGGGASGAGGSASGGSLMDGWLADDDTWMQMLSRGLPGLLGAFGAYNQSQDYKDLSNKYQEMGAPYRGKLAELYGNPEAFLNSAEVRVPIQQGTDMLARSLSTKGNPVGSGNALQEIQNYASNQLFSRLGQEKDRLAGFGGLSQYNQAAPQAAQNQLQSQRGIYDAFGGMSADVFNPPKKYSLQDLLRQF